MSVDGAKVGEAQRLEKLPMHKEILDGIFDGIDAVSYTHLDVYKRQAKLYVLQHLNSIFLHLYTQL